MKKRLLLLFVGWLVCSFGVGQNPVTGKLTLEEAIKIAHARSPQADGATQFHVAILEFSFIQGPVVALA